jgi:predicted GIY-YIG superfamily endonuclease
MPISSQIPEIVYVYIFRTVDDLHYVGITNNLVRRWREHLKGHCPFTKRHRVSSLIYFAAFPNRIAAAHFERYIKNRSTRRFIRSPQAKINKIFLPPTS